MERVELYARVRAEVIAELAHYSNGATETPTPRTGDASLPRRQLAALFERLLHLERENDLQDPQEQQ